MAHRRASASAVRWASSRSADSAASHACRDSRCSESSFARLVASCGAGAECQLNLRCDISGLFRPSSADYGANTLPAVSRET